MANRLAGRSQARETSPITPPHGQRGGVPKQEALYPAFNEPSFKYEIPTSRASAISRTGPHKASVEFSMLCIQKFLGIFSIKKRENKTGPFLPLLIPPGHDPTRMRSLLAPCYLLQGAGIRNIISPAQEAPGAVSARSSNRKRSELVERFKNLRIPKKQKHRNPRIEPSIKTMVLGTIDRGAGHHRPRGYVTPHTAPNHLPPRYF